MQFQRLLSKASTPIQDQVEWIKTTSRITSADGAIIFEMKDVEHPKGWSKNAIDILAQKYFRKAGVGKEFKFRQESNLPSWLNPSLPCEGTIFGSESSAKQVFHRLAGAWTYWGWKEKIFGKQATPEYSDYSSEMEKNAQIFYDELYLMLAFQIAAPNSPQWFNTGLHWAYGIEGSESGQWAVTEDGTPYQTSNAYERPQPHACFIQPVSDDLVNPGGIMDLWQREVRLFKQGSGTGSNFSQIRGKGERLSGGGVSSGLMSFLEIGDVSAKSIKSGGVTRRAAKMCVLDLDHPEILEFINWKAREEYKATCMNIGSRILHGDAYIQGENALNIIPSSIHERINQGGFKSEVFGLDWQGEAITSVQGQNSNNSVRITNHFLDMLIKNEIWNLISRTKDKHGRTHTTKTIKAKQLWYELCRSAWACGDPGVQFEDTINSWHTCKADGRINASNPCSEYLFLDDTACNLASLNLVSFLDKTTGAINTKLLLHATRLWTTVLEISVFMASFPSREIALGSYNYRTLGLGYANLGSLLMQKALPYDSDKGRNLAAMLTAIIHAQSYITSFEMGEELGAFPRWEANKESFTEVLEMHCDCISGLGGNDFELIKLVTNLYTQLRLYSSADFGPRNAQVTNIAPTGTISFVMDCDTTGCEPSFQQRSFKSLAGGGDIILENQSIAEALKVLNYTPAQILSILQHIKETGTIETWTLNGRTLPEEHLQVFDCANPGTGKRSISFLGHIKMVAAIQPFLSGGVSKTINLPNNATIEDVSEAYLTAHKLGVKSIALYRDGSKLDQPLKSFAKTTQHKPIIYEQDVEQITAFDPPTELVFSNTPNENVIPINSSQLPRGHRVRTPDSGQAFKQKVRLDGHALYITHGLYPDGTLGEIFLELSKEGSTVRALLNSFAKAISIGIQYGVPLEKFVESFVYTKFEPSGIVEGHEHVKMASSLLDLIFRILAIKYLGQIEYSNLEAESIGEQVINNSPSKASAFASLSAASAPKQTLEECPYCKTSSLIRVGPSCSFCTNCKRDSGCG
jgi:ribonucleoside-diphosphate reductase alpha chain